MKIRQSQLQAERGDDPSFSPSELIWCYEKWQRHNLTIIHRAFDGSHALERHDAHGRLIGHQTIDESSLLN